jgi:uncharacterized protein (DUF433 family)
MGGKSCIRGMWVTVGTIVDLLSTDRSHEEILIAYPYLVPEDITEELAYADDHSILDSLQNSDDRSGDKL